MRKRLTERQQQIYTFIVHMIREKGYPPTIRDIMEEFKIASTNGVRTTLLALAKKGYINRHPKLSRGIELTDYVERMIPGSGKVREIPIVGRIAAGEPILAVENLEGTLNIDSTFVPSETLFALMVHGESMKNAGILDGDYVFARQQGTADNGDIVVAVIGEEATVKRYKPEKNRILLMPENEAYEPIVVSPWSPDFRIAGRVVGVIRRL
jgi:repressor LexA